MNTSHTNKIAKVCRILGLYIALDLEWDNLTHVLLAASFVDSLGRKRVYLNKGSEIKLIEDLLLNF
jgi:hypothetical protein